MFEAFPLLSTVKWIVMSYSDSTEKSPITCQLSWVFPEIPRDDFFFVLALRLVGCGIVPHDSCCVLLWLASKVQHGF